MEWETMLGESCFLGLDETHTVEWNHFLSGLNQNGYVLKDCEDSLAWSWDKAIGHPSAKMDYKALGSVQDHGDLKWWPKLI